MLIADHTILMRLLCIFFCEWHGPEVMLAMQSVGICGSDIHFWMDGKIGDYVLNSPMVMGHEGCGLVIAAGEGVAHLKQGGVCVGF